MQDTDRINFVPMEQVREKALEIFHTQKKFIDSLGLGVDVQHVGGTSVPGALTKFDVDINIRIPAEEYARCVEVLKKHLPPKHEALWKEGFAIFEDEILGISTDYCVTAIDSPYDEFYKMRDFFIAHPEALQKYNEFKMRYQGKLYSEYRAAKKELFGPNGTTTFLQ